MARYADDVDVPLAHAANSIGFAIYEPLENVTVYNLIKVCSIEELHYMQIWLYASSNKIYDIYKSLETHAMVYWKSDCSKTVSTKQFNHRICILNGRNFLVVSIFRSH
jgi:hypothetical protein